VRRLCGLGALLLPGMCEALVPCRDATSSCGACRSAAEPPLTESAALCQAAGTSELDAAANRLTDSSGQLGAQAVPSAWPCALLKSFVRASCMGWDGVRSASALLLS